MTCCGESEDLKLMRYMMKNIGTSDKKAFWGMVDFLRAMGILIGPKRVRRLLRKNGHHGYLYRNET
jgi:hypothetical protein